MPVRLLFVALACLVSSSALAQELPAEPEIFEVVEEKPELIGGLAALQGRVVYPEMARRAGIEGKVFVQFVVDEKGVVTEAYGVRCPDPLLCEAGIQAVRESRFTPGRQDGVPVKVRFTLPIDFKLTGGDDVAPEASPEAYLPRVLGDSWDRASADREIGAPVFGQVKNGEGTLIYEAPSSPEVDRVLLTVQGGRAQSVEVRFIGRREELERNIAQMTERVGPSDDGWFSLHSLGGARRVRFLPEEDRAILEYSPLAPEAAPAPPLPAPDDRGEIYEMAETQPVLVGGLEGLQARLVYPPEAQEAGIEGRAFVRIVSEVDGSVSEPVCVSGDPLLCAAAIDAIREATFTPGLMRGRPVRVRFTMSVSFSLR